MKAIAQILAFAAGTLICGCETTSPARGDRTSPSNSSTFVHPFSKFAFPDSVGVFRRIEVRKYDREGRDVGVGYNSSTPIAATVFVYPGPKDFSILPSPMSSDVSQGLLGQHFQTCKQEILRSHPDARLISERSFKLIQGDNQFEGMKATFSMSYKFGLTSQDSTSEVYLFLVEPGMKLLVTGRQFVKYRATYPTTKGAQAESEFAAFMTNLVWPTK
jgi:hypothetical protein